MTLPAANDEPRYNITTETLAASASVKPGSIRTRLCRTGSYFGLRPRKLANGRLLWPENSVEQLFRAAESGDTATPPQAA